MTFRQIFRRLYPSQLTKVLKDLENNFKRCVQKGVRLHVKHAYMCACVKKDFTHAHSYVCYGARSHKKSHKYSPLKELALLSVVWGLVGVNVSAIRLL